uniref:UBX domain-containing protein n=1 Tax=Panagrellus redivivus TaxID=6233 RepID=A0A7E4WC97_PANRE
MGKPNSSKKKGGPNSSLGPAPGGGVAAPPALPGPPRPVPHLVTLTLPSGSISFRGTVAERFERGLLGFLERGWLGATGTPTPAPTGPSAVLGMPPLEAGVPGSHRLNSAQPVPRLMASEILPKSLG